MITAPPSTTGRQLAYVETAGTAITPFTTRADITGLITPEFTVGARGAIVHVHLASVFASSASTVEAYISDAAGTILRKEPRSTGAANNNIGIDLFSFIPAAGTYQRKAQLARTVGSGTITVNVAGDTTYVSFIRVTEC